MISIEDGWLPPKDVDSKVTILHDSQGILSEYLLIYYYAVISLIGTDLIPVSESELLSCLFLLLLGPVMIGILIGQFSNILYDLTAKERQRTEVHDLIANTMYSLRLPIEIQNRVDEYYDITTESSIYYDQKAFDSLNYFLQDQIIIAKSKSTISKISFIDLQHQEKLKALILNLELQHFQSGDIILKQGEIGHKF